MKNSLIAAIVLGPTTDQASQKNSTGNPSGTGALLFGIPKIIPVISSAKLHPNAADSENNVKVSDDDEENLWQLMQLRKKNELNFKEGYGDLHQLAQ